MELAGKRIGFAITGSFCTFELIKPVIGRLTAEGADIKPILSYSAASYDTRYSKAADFREYIENATGNKVWDSIVDVEPVGPKKLLDIVIIAPCTGNTLAKLALGITDTPVLLAVKSHLRNARPVLLAVSTNDALGANSKNLGVLHNAKNVFFVPYRQDNYLEKGASIVADMGLIPDAAKLALEYIQLQPVMLAPR